MSYACYIQRIIPPASLVIESPWTDDNNSNGKKSLNKGSYSSNNNNKFTPSISVSLLGKNGNRFFAIFFVPERKKNDSSVSSYN